MTESSDDAIGYRDAGVDIDAGNRLIDRIKPAVRRASRPEVIGGLGGFGGLFRLGKDFRDPVLVSGTDGVGTKLLLARRLGIRRGLGVDLVAMCVNDIVVCGAEPLFFLDYYACGRLDVDEAAEVIEGIAEGCRLAGCALIGGETAEMPGMYAPGDFDLAGFAVGVVERDRIVDGSRIDEDCVVLGLPSSGPHSNGYSLIRKVLERSGGPDADPDRGRALLEPTRIYVGDVLPLLGRYDVRGMAHITGGGLAENIARVLPQGCDVLLDPRSWQIPAVFEWLARNGPVAEHEMRRTFNLGIGFVLIAPADQADAITDDLLERTGRACLSIGRVIASSSSSPRVHFDPA